MAIENFKAGLLNGRVEYYYANEKLQGVENWANGVLTDSAVYFYDNGNQEKSGKYRDSQYEGEWKFYSETGSLLRIVNYRNGVPDGRTVVYDGKGKSHRKDITMKERSTENGNFIRRVVSYPTRATTRRENEQVPGTSTTTKATRKSGITNWLQTFSRGF